MEIYGRSKGGLAHEWQSSGRVGGIRYTRYSPKAQQKKKMKAPNMKTSNYDNNTSSVTYPLPKHSPASRAPEGCLQIHTVVLYKNGCRIGLIRFVISISSCGTVTKSYFLTRGVANWFLQMLILTMTVSNQFARNYYYVIVEKETQERTAPWFDLNSTRLSDCNHGLVGIVVAH